MKLLEVTAKKTGDTVTIWRANGEVFCKYPRHYSGCPDYRHRYITLNCYRWRIRWIKEVP